MDVLVAGIGTGGTITGISRYIKQVKGKQILVGRHRARQQPGDLRSSWPASRMRPGPHKIQGIGAGFIPDTLDLSLVDRVELVGNEESIEMARRLAQRGRNSGRHFLRRRRGRGRPPGRECLSLQARPS